MLGLHYNPKQRAKFSALPHPASVRRVRTAKVRPRAVSPHKLLTFKDVENAAKQRNLSLGLKTLGPFYRIVCRDGDEDGKILAVTSGFIMPPLSLMHCDTLQIFTRGLKGSEGERVRGGALGLGLLMGRATFAYGYSCGCKKAEILAIDDDDTWHLRLVQYYKYFGFQPVKYVGGRGLVDLPDMLVWGGAGTLMDADVEAMLQRWGGAMQQEDSANVTGST